MHAVYVGLRSHHCASEMPFSRLIRAFGPDSSISSPYWQNMRIFLSNPNVMNDIHRLLTLLGLASVVIAFSSVLASASAGDFRVGAGKISITTNAAEFPYMPSDRPSLNTRPGELSFVGVHDEVFARALVVDDGLQVEAVVVLEVTAVPAAGEISEAISRALKVRESNVLIVATHTHSVPLFSYAGGEVTARERKEIERLKSGAVAAVREANAHLQAARVAFGRGESWVNTNNGEEKGSRIGYDPSGPSDKTVDVVRFETRDGKPIALIVNYASHAEVMFRSVTRDGGYEVSGDLPGAVSRLLETQATAPIVLYTSGAEADQLPLFKSRQEAGLMPASDEGAAGWALLDVQARRLAASVMQVIADMPRGMTEAKISSAVSSVTCAGQQLSINPKTGKTTVESRPPVAIPLAMIRINDIAIAGVGGDVATEIGEHFKAASTVPHSMFITMMAPSVGYIFADSSYVHPGHGLSKSPLEPGCAEDAIVNRLVQMVDMYR